MSIVEALSAVALWYLSGLIGCALCFWGDYLDKVYYRRVAHKCPSPGGLFLALLFSMFGFLVLIGGVVMMIDSLSLTKPWINRVSARFEKWWDTPICGADDE